MANAYYWRSRRQQVLLGNYCSRRLCTFRVTYSNANGQSNAWVVKIDPNANVFWNKTFGNATDTAATSGVLAPDGNYMVAGYTNSRGDNNYDFLLMQIDPNGNMVWNKTYGQTGSQEASAMTKAPDGYVIVGNTQSPDGIMHAWVVKVDWNGTMLWAETVGAKTQIHLIYNSMLKVVVT